jgi:2-polyprenyl-6-methoxyphenol hydroxylase-like FAD-dependent oxidoreductase
VSKLVPPGRPDLDVLIAGGGPAGAATALALARIAPGLTATIVQPKALDAPPGVGEAVPPVIRPFLSELRILEAFEGAGHAPAYRTLSAWGSAALVANEFLLHAEPRGWRLDRTRFDAMLLSQAAARGVTHLPSQLTGLTRTSEGWIAELGAQGRHGARIVVDATGRTAIACRLAGRRVERHDRQVAAIAWLPPPSASATKRHPDDDVVVTEACPDGWWYTVGLPDGGRVVAFMTDGDIAHHLCLKHPAGFAAALAGTSHVGRLAAPALPLTTKPRLVAAGSARVAPAVENGLIAVGDAAMAFDPLAALGIVKALRSGLYAAYAIADALVAGDPGGFARYQALATRDYASYSRRHAQVYRQETRWPAAPYWARRRS